MALALRRTGEQEADQRVIEDLQDTSDCTATVGEDTIPPQANEVESATKAQRGDFRQEDQRLRMYLEEIMQKDYGTLQEYIHGKAQQERQGATGDKGKDHEQQDESELISLSLGRSSCPKKEALCKGSTNWKGDDHPDDLALGLDLNSESPKSGGSTTPSFTSKPSPANSSEASEHKSRKKARVCVRTRCDTPTMNDGCHWRKYGQKKAKGNPCPRAYYRCTISTSCPVRKQVQRCANDLSVLLTTYEGTHNHPLPMSATAMASTTSAAASMLLSGSSSSQGKSFPNNTAAAASLHGVNFYLDHDSTKRKLSCYLSDTFVSPSSSQMITLDLTSPQTSSLSPFNRFPASKNINPPIYSSTTLNFSSSEPYAMSWGNGFLGYGSSQPFSYNSNLGTINTARHTLQNVYRSPHIQNNNSSTLPQHTLQQDAITAATKAITADPRFQSALAAALSSIMGNTDQCSDGGTVIPAPGHQIGGGNISQRLNSWSNQIYPVASTLQSTSKVNLSSSGFLDNTASTNAHPGGLVYLPPSCLFSFAGSKEASSTGRDKQMKWLLKDTR